MRLETGYHLTLITSFLERMVETLGPDDDVAPSLLLHTPHGWKREDLTAALTEAADVEPLLVSLLPRIISEHEATEAIFISATWVANTRPNDSVEDAAVQTHLASGGRIAEWPLRQEAISALFVVRNEPALTLVALLERHAESHPTINRWTTCAGFTPELVSALQQSLSVLAA